VPIKRRVSLPVLSLSDQRLQRRLQAKGGVFAFAPTACLVHSPYLPANLDQHYPTFNF
jgi:hypothetical protein